MTLHKMGGAEKYIAVRPTGVTSITIPRTSPGYREVQVYDSGDPTAQWVLIAEGTYDSAVSDLYVYAYNTLSKKLTLKVQAPSVNYYGLLAKQSFLVNQANDYFTIAGWPVGSGYTLKLFSLSTGALRLQVPYPLTKREPAFITHPNGKDLILIYYDYVSPYYYVRCSVVVLNANNTASLAQTQDLLRWGGGTGYSADILLSALERDNRKVGTYLINLIQQWDPGSGWSPARLAKKMDIGTLVFTDLGSTQNQALICGIRAPLTNSTNIFDTTTEKDMHYYDISTGYSALPSLGTCATRPAYNTAIFDDTIIGGATNAYWVTFDDNGDTWLYKGAAQPVPGSFGSPIFRASSVNGMTGIYILPLSKEFFLCGSITGSTTTVPFIWYPT